MKMRFLVALALLSAVAAAQTPKPAAPAPVKPEANKTAKKEAAPKIAGIVIARANGKFLGLTLEGGSFKLSFYDKDRKAVPADFPRALARWNPNYKQGSERMILNLSSDGQSLVGPRPVRPPHTFKLYLTLLAASPANEDGSGGEQAGESYVVDFRN